MAEDNCLGDGNKKWTSTLTPTGGSPKDDGTIRIFKESNKLKGKHEKTNVDLENLACDGTNISFDRLEPKAGGTQARVFYTDGKISGPSGGKFHIRGKYREENLPTPALQNSKSERGKSGTKGKPGLVDNETGDWSAERPEA